MNESCAIISGKTEPPYNNSGNKCTKLGEIAESYMLLKEELASDNLL